jgi:hypothetical protein
MRNRVKKIIVSRGIFTPCTLTDSLLEAVTEAARNATAGGAASGSPAWWSFEWFQNYRHCSEGILPARKSISGGGRMPNPHMSGKDAGDLRLFRISRRKPTFSLRGFLRENRGANEPIKSTSQKGRR